MQTPDKYDAVLKAIDRYGTAMSEVPGTGPLIRKPSCVDARNGLNKAIDEWIAARDEEIRAEEREACARVAEGYGCGKSGCTECYAGAAAAAIRARGEPTCPRCGDAVAKSDGCQEPICPARAQGAPAKPEEGGE